jgi:oligosaccharide repeat unit polymerase
MPDPSTLTTGLIALTLLALAWVARAVLRERWHPAVFFALTWFAVLMLVIAAAPLGFYGVTPQTALVFLVGAVLFLIGAKAGDRVALATTGQQRPDPWDHLKYRSIAMGCLLAHLVMLPLTWLELVRISGYSDDLLLIAFFVRENTAQGLDTFNALVGNYLVFGFILVPVLAMGAFRGHLSTRLAIAAALPCMLINLVASGRSSLVQMMVALAYLRATQAKPVNLRMLLVGLMLFMLMFGGGVVLVAKGDVRPEDGLPAVLLGILRNLSDYALQGPVLFSRYFMQEINVVSTWDPLVFGCQVLQSFGMCTRPAQHQEFAQFGHLEQYGNVYTIYFSVLPKYGPIGMVCLLLFYGAWTAWHHRRHQQHSALAHSLLAGYLFAAVIISIFSDSFAPNLNFLIKTTVTAMLLQRFVSFTPLVVYRHSNSTASA